MDTPFIESFVSSVVSYAMSRESESKMQQDYANKKSKNAERNTKKILSTETDLPVSILF